MPPRTMLSARQQPCSSQPSCAPTAQSLLRAATATVLLMLQAQHAHAVYSAGLALRYYSELWPEPLPEVKACAMRLPRPLDPSSPNKTLAAPAAELFNITTNVTIGSTNTSWSSGSERRPHSLVIVMSFSDDWAQTEMDKAVVEAWQLYAQLHGYHFMMQHLPAHWAVQTDAVRKKQSFYFERWHSLLRNGSLWAKHTHILHVDGDTLPLGMHNSLNAFLDMQQHILLHVRENYEVHAAAVLMRTTPYARCFLRHWTSYSHRFGTNVDNGDLLQSVMDFVDPELARTCTPLRSNYDGSFIPCFSKAHVRLLTAHQLLPFRFFFPLGGFLRSHEGLKWKEDGKAIVPWDAFFFYCWSNDVIGHGWKQIGQMWFNRSAAATTAGTTVTTAGTTATTAGTDATAAGTDATTAGNIALPQYRFHCQYMSPDEELQAAKDCCMWHYPGCMGVGAQINPCRHATRCRAGSLGVPTCGRTFPKVTDSN